MLLCRNAQAQRRKRGKKQLCMGGSQSYGPFLGTQNIRCRVRIGTQKGAIILTTTHMRAATRKKSRRVPGLRVCRASKGSGSSS